MAVVDKLITNHINHIIILESRNILIIYSLKICQTVHNQIFCFPFFRHVILTKHHFLRIPGWVGRCGDNQYCISRPTTVPTMWARHRWRDATTHQKSLLGPRELKSTFQRVVCILEEWSNSSQPQNWRPHPIQFQADRCGSCFLEIRAKALRWRGGR